MMNKKFKNKKLIKTICGLLVLCMALALWGCSPTEKDNTEEVATVNVSISIDYPAKAKKPDLKTLPFRAEEDSTVLQVVELYGNVNNMSILVDTTYSTLEGVDGVINGVTLKTGQWQYKINGKATDKAISEAILKDGDHLELVYAKVKTEE